MAPAAELFERPRHPYTRLLMDALPGSRHERAAAPADRGRDPQSGSHRRRAAPSIRAARWRSHRCRSELPLLLPYGDRQGRLATPSERAGLRSSKPALRGLAAARMVLQHARCVEAGDLRQLLFRPHGPASPARRRSWGNASARRSGWPRNRAEGAFEGADQGVRRIRRQIACRSIRSWVAGRASTKIPPVVGRTVAGQAAPRPKEKGLG